MPQRATFKVPRLYKAAANVASVIKNENGNLEQLVEQYKKKTNAKALAALVSKTVKNEDLLDKILKNSQILVKEPKDDPWLLRILIAELLLGKQRLPIGSKTIQTVLSYGPILRTELMKAQGKHVGKRKRSEFTMEDSDNSSSESTKIEEPESTELSDKDTSIKHQKRKKDRIETSVEGDSIHYNKPKKMKKSKKKRKGNEETLPGVNEDECTVDESVDTNLQLPKSIQDEQEDDNHESSSTGHSKKKKQYKQSKEKSVNKEKSSYLNMKSATKKEKKKKSFNID